MLHRENSKENRLQKLFYFFLNNQALSNDTTTRSVLKRCPFRPLKKNGHTSAKLWGRKFVQSIKMTGDLDPSKITNLKKIPSLLRCYWMRDKRRISLCNWATRRSFAQLKSENRAWWLTRIPMSHHRPLRAPTFPKEGRKWPDPRWTPVPWLDFQRRTSCGRFTPCNRDKRATICRYQQVGRLWILGIPTRADTERRCCHLGLLLGDAQSL